MVNYGAQAGLSTIEAGTPETKLPSATQVGSTADIQAGIAHRKKHRQQLNADHELSKLYRNRRRSQALIILGIMSTIFMIWWYPTSGIQGKWGPGDLVVGCILTGSISVVGLVIRPSAERMRKLHLILNKAANHDAPGKNFPLEN